MNGVFTGSVEGSGVSTGILSRLKFTLVPPVIHLLLLFISPGQERRNNISLTVHPLAMLACC